MNKFIYIAPHIVGNASEWGYCYDSDLKEFKTKEEAERHALRTLGHDDFWIGEIKNGKVISLYSGEKKRTNKKNLKEINEKFSFSS